MALTVPSLTPRHTLPYILAMKMANIADVKDNLSAMLREVEQGEEVVICRYGRPVARLIGVAKARRNTMVLGWSAGEGRVLDDLQGPFLDPADWHMHREP